VANDRDARLNELLDRQDIYDCLVRMSRGTDRFDRELFLSGLHDDAVMAAGPFVGSGQEMVDWSSELQEMAHTGTFHNLLNHSCEIDGDVAHAETYYLFVAMNRDQTNLLAGGRYIDKFERRGGEWKLALRNNMIEWSSVVPALDNPLANFPGIDANGVAARGKDDISYRRPLTNVREHNVPKFG
jgi:hypothetical protein